MKKLKILHLEDNNNDAELVREELINSLNLEIDFVTVEKRNDFLKQLYGFKPDIILSDYRLPQYNGITALEDLKDSGLDIPFIIVTGSLTEETAADTIKAGAWDYVVKERLFRLKAAVKNALQVKDEKHRKMEVEKKLLTLSKAVEQAPVSIVMTDKNGKIQYVNPMFETLTGYTSEEVIDKTPRILKSGEHSEEFYNELWKTILSGNDWKGILKNRKKNGEYYWGNANISSLKDNKGDIMNFIGIKLDVTEHIHADDALRESEQRYQLLSNATFEAIFISRKGLCINQNKTAEKMFGFTLEEAIGKPGIDWIAEESKELVKMNIMSNYEKPYEAVAIRKDGSKFPCEIQAHMMNYKGETIRLTALRDVSQRKVAEKALIKSERKYRELIENQGEGIILADLKEKISFANPAAELIFGVGKNGLLNRSFEDFTSTEQFEKILKESKQRKKGTKSTYEVEITGGDNEKRNILLTATPRTDDVGNVIGSFGIIVDITERKQILNELKIAKEKAEESDHLKTVFLQNMSHEVRTPMNGIIGFSEMLKDPDTSDAKRNSYLNIIINSSQQLLSIIQDIITISSIETKQEMASREATSVNDVLLELQTLHNRKAREKGLLISGIKSLPDNEVFIYSDPTKLRQILDNLINNAIKFTPEGSIDFGYNIKDNFIEFYIKDTGIGVDSKLHDKIFSRFWQVEQGTTRSYGGTGLGLSISKGYVELLGGKIWLESELKKGSSFYFTIPYIPVDKTFIRKTTQKYINSVDWNGKSILVAEDEYINFVYLEELLGTTGAKVYYAKNGQEAVDFALSNKLDLILMDIKMPELNGYEATAKIRQEKPELPIIAQTAYVNTEDIEKAKAAGCTDFITKPIRRNDLIKIIEEHWN
ncbi:MAG: PAS domain S-box protein [Bacteroidales bacterium]|nr:PAS domain S-box protein [Bacteroidales bacterium]